MYDSLIEKQANRLIICGLTFYRYAGINKANDFLKLNSIYNGKIYFAEIHSGAAAYTNCIFKYVLPTKERSFDRENNLTGNITSMDDFFTFHLHQKILAGIFGMEK